MTVQTACSTSLVAVHHGVPEPAESASATWRSPAACRSRCRSTAGYLYQEEGIASPDGHCRAFDARGARHGRRQRRRHRRAQAARRRARRRRRHPRGDPGTAINNDGAHKVGYTAPSVEGQAEVIAEAHRPARVDPASIGYVEAHGTGDAARRSDRDRRPRRRRSARMPTPASCAIGSVKTNVGHLDAAAGVTGLIKTVLALEHREIPPSLHFERPNPRIDFAIRTASS